jgi:uncharacterized protein (TIGR01777 family)
MSRPRRIVLPGGSGQIGTILARAFAGRGDEVVVLSRAADAGPSATRPWRIRRWDPGAQDLGSWAEEIDGADVVVNLAGRSVDCRYNRRNREQIMNSRTTSTRAVGEAIARAVSPPPVWLQASTATIYEHTFGRAHDEENGVLGGAEPDAPASWRFSIDVARAWEDACRGFDERTEKTRKVLLRSAMTMSPDRGGVFDVLLGLVRRGLGGRNADGRQFVSWIHDRDFVRAIEFLIERDDLAGPVNLAAPHPLPNAEFLAALRRAAGVPFGLPATRWMLEVGAWFLRTETELVLKSRRVVPGRLLASGFCFDYETWPEAAIDLVERSRRGSRRAAAAS